MTHRPTEGASAHVACMVAVVATYVYFLLYAQFGFIHALNEALPGQDLVQRAMGVMGISGTVASIILGYALRSIASRTTLIIGYVGAALAAGLAVIASSPARFMVTAGAVGIFTAMITVPLAANLRGFMKGQGFGLKVGAATGVAYFLCNIPQLFEGAPAFQGGVAAVCCLAGAGACFFLPAKPFSREPASPSLTLTKNDYRGVGFVSIVLSFLALVWLDSAAFATIQETAALKGQTWATSGQKVLMGSVHLLAAVLAGWLFDRGHFRSILMGTFALFAVAFTGLEQGVGLHAVGGPLYAVGISFYSVALVLYPSSWRDEHGVVPARWRAALLFGIAGWIGSALGVGMAQHLHHIPPLFLWTAGGLIVAAWMLSSSSLRKRRAGLLNMPTAFGACAIVLCLAWPELYGHANHADIGAAGMGGDALDDARARGKRIYIQEGCINCHSQFIRPGTFDEELWGPYRDVNFEEQPPMIGNRRQGPDLMNVGNRRNREWQELHLVDPAAVSPGSKMPSYRHLFSDGSTRGDDLVTYLLSLGEHTMEERLTYIQTWSPREQRVGSVSKGKKLFQHACTPCHGMDGTGSGPLADRLFRPAMNLKKGPLWYVPADPSPVKQANGLAKLIKFGLPGTSMAGHEYFSEQELANLVAYVQTLVPTNASAGTKDL